MNLWNEWFNDSLKIHMFSDRWNWNLNFTESIRFWNWNWFSIPNPSSDRVCLSLTVDVCMRFSQSSLSSTKASSDRRALLLELLLFISGFVLFNMNLNKHTHAIIHKHIIIHTKIRLKHIFLSEASALTVIFYILVLTNAHECECVCVCVCVCPTTDSRFLASRSVFLSQKWFTSISGVLGY